MKNHNIPKVYANTDMIRLCAEFGTENKSNEFMKGWRWFYNNAFPLDGNIETYPAFIRLPDDSSKEFIEGANKCQRLISTFYEEATIITWTIF